jgi:hypothetical protein
MFEYVFQVGAALSMTYITGQPIIFVGCGQVLMLCWMMCDALIASTDIHRSEAAESGKRCPSYPGRLNFHVDCFMICGDFNVSFFLAAVTAIFPSYYYYRI